MTALQALAELRHRDPERVRGMAAVLLEDAALPGPVRATAEWVLGLALHELGRPAAAAGHLRTAVRLATRGRNLHTAAVARAGLAMSLLAVGDAAAAHREIVRARAGSPPSAVTLVEPLWAVWLQRAGRHDEALQVLDDVLPALQRAHDRAGAARLLLNRGTLFAYQGRFDRAAADLTEAERLATDRGLWLLAAMAAHNLGFTEGRRNDLPAGLAGFDRALAAYHAVGDPPRQVTVLAADHCELLLRAGLSRDARIGAERAVSVLEAAGEVDVSHATEIRLLLAQALLAEGALHRAAAEAARSAEAFRAARRTAWAALADYVAVQAEIAAAEEELRLPETLLRRTRTIARALDAHGWPVEAMHVRTFLGRVALSLGRDATVRRELAPVAATRHRGTVDARTTAWQATALLLLASGRRGEAKRALRRGLALVEEYRAGLTTTELRVGAAARGTELARLGLRLALADGRPLEVLRWAERWRAGALRCPPVHPPTDDVLAEAVALLHVARSELRSATLDEAPTQQLQKRVSQLESDVRARSLRAGGAASVAMSGLQIAAVRAALGEAVLVEYIALEGTLSAVTLSAGRARLYHLGRVGEVRREIAYLLSGQRRAIAASLRRGTMERAPALAPLAGTARRLATLLLGPLGLGSTSPLVVVPTGALHGLPWPALPDLYGRPLVVAPSADLWSRRARPVIPVPDEDVTLVAGPDLPGADAEIGRLAADVYPASRVLRGSAATVRRVLDALGRSDLVHVAAHGRFRADSPLFSSLALADGALTVLDMEGLPAAPSTVVLPACEAGRTEVLAGDELIGTTTALLGRGVRSVIAPVLPVPDLGTADLMVALHRGLRSGCSPSEALAAAAAEVADEPLPRAVAETFVCLGAAETATTTTG